MDTVKILRDLWRFRVLLVEVCLVALLVGFAILYKVSFPPKIDSRKYEVGVATSRILVDTPSSQVVEIAPKGTDTLGVRANLIASLMVDGEVKTAIAERARVNPAELVGVSTSATESPVARPHNPRASVLTTRVVTDNDGVELPIIEIEAQAGDVAAAMRLASAAISGLRDYLDSKAAVQRIPDAERLQVSGLGAPQAEMATRGPKTVFAVIAVIFVFGAGCACILGLLALVRAWRATSPGEDGFGTGAFGVPNGSAPAEGVDEPRDEGSDGFWKDAWPPSRRRLPRMTRTVNGGIAVADDESAERA